MGAVGRALALMMKGAYPLSCIVLSSPLSAANNGVTFITRKRRRQMIHGTNLASIRGGNVDPWENEIKRLQDFYRSNQGAGDGGMSVEREDSEAHVSLPSEPNESGGSKDIGIVAEGSELVESGEDSFDVLNETEQQQPPSDIRNNIIVDIPDIDEDSHDGEKGFDVAGSHRSTKEVDDGIQASPDFANTSEADEQSIRPNNPIDAPGEDVVEVEGDVDDVKFSVATAAESEVALQSEQEDDNNKNQSVVDSIERDIAKHHLETCIEEDEITGRDTSTNVEEMRAPFENANEHVITRFLPSGALFKQLRKRLRHPSLISRCWSLGDFVLVTALGSAITAATMNTFLLNRDGAAEDNDDDEK